MTIEPVVWDSQFFNLRIGKLLVMADDLPAEVWSTLHAASVFDLVYVFTAQQVKLTGYAEHCRLVDEKVVFRFSDQSALKPNLSPSTVSIREFTDKQPNEALVNLALQSGVHSRFYSDKRFPSGSYEKLYTEWINKSTDGTLADKILIAEVGHALAGFISLKIKPTACYIDLVAVDEHYRNKGIGQQLLAKTVELFKATANSSLYVGTQRLNVKACRLYEKNGFVMHEQTNIYHFWYSIT